MVNVNHGVYSCAMEMQANSKFTHFQIKREVIYYRDMTDTWLYLWVMQTYTGNSCY